MDAYKRYRLALRDGDTDKATQIYLDELKEDVSETKEKDFVEDDEQKEKEEEEETGDVIASFEEINGIGNEIAEELEEAFGSIEKLAEADLAELEDVSGIGSSRAESIKEQLK